MAVTLSFVTNKQSPTKKNGLFCDVAMAANLSFVTNKHRTIPNLQKQLIPDVTMAASLQYLL